MSALLRLATVALLLFAQAANSASSLAQVELAGHRFTVEIADTDASRERGLMYRNHLAADHGMLFVYPAARVRRFWMKHTLIPLDILFFDADRRLINVSADTPPCKTPDCPTYASAAPAMYVLELAAGSAARLRIRAGDTLTLRP